MLSIFAAASIGHTHSKHATMAIPTSYRPHNSGHDYYAPGVYLITLVTRGRVAHFGQLNDDAHHPQVLLSPTGLAVMDCWQSIPAHHAARGRRIRLHGAVCMTDHFHGVIEVEEAMDKSVGEVIRGFKAGCTMAWHELADSCSAGPAGGSDQRPSMAAGMGPTTGADMAPIADPITPDTPTDMAWLAAGHDDPDDRPSLVDRAQLKRMSKHQRALYYAAHPEAQQPLFDDNYDDTICLTDPITGQYDQRHFQAMIHYVEDNPRRAIVRRLNPQFMEHRQHIRIAGRDYAAFGNLFLLRWARKVQVFCHRRSEDGRSRYTDTEAFRDDCRRWKAQVMAGATVLVTPGISPGELLIKNRCLEQGYPLIHLQKEPLPPYKKPEKTRFEACASGRLLILSPWQPEALGDYHGVPSETDYSIFHNLNTLAAEICAWDGELRWIGGER